MHARWVMSFGEMNDDWLMITPSFIADSRVPNSTNQSLLSRNLPKAHQEYLQCWMELKSSTTVDSWIAQKPPKHKDEKHSDRDIMDNL